jgi:3'-phosphoadenosine 5'-phosphosulfate sulfotransferase (PAPS reductase)/FAD synthetase
MSDTRARTPEEIVAEAIERYKPVAIYVGFSGGNDSRAVAHWMMNNVPGCQPFHANTGIGIERTREYVRETCKAYGWTLNEIRALEDCGQDYEALCLKHGFPGPDGHQMMYSRLKERCVRQLVRRAKQGHPRSAKVLIASGIRHDESLIRMGYAGREINTVGAQLWINPLYWWTKKTRDAYNETSGMPENPVTKALGMSGECGCGAFAHRGELDRWRAVDPAFGERIDRLQQGVLERGFTWSWEGRPPKGGHTNNQISLFQRPLCVGCEKSAIVQEELASIDLASVGQV